MNRELFRKNVRWAGLVVLIHIGALIVFGIFFSSTLQRLEDNELIALAHRNALLGDVVLWTVFSVFYFKITSTFADYKRLLKDAMKEDGFSVFGYYKRQYLREDIWKMAILSAFQIPFMAFFAMAGISYLYSTPIDKFYMLEAGFYGMSGSSILGLLISTVIFSVIFLIFRFVFLALTVRGIKKY